MSQKLKSTLACLLESFFRQRLMAQRRASPQTVSSYRDALQLLITFTSERVVCQVSFPKLACIAFAHFAT